MTTEMNDELNQAWDAIEKVGSAVEIDRKSYNGHTVGDVDIIARHNGKQIDIWTRIKGSEVWTPVRHISDKG